MSDGGATGDSKKTEPFQVWQCIRKPQHEHSRGKDDGMSSDIKAKLVMLLSPPYHVQCAIRWMKRMGGQMSGWACFDCLLLFYRGIIDIDSETKVQQKVLRGTNVHDQVAPRCWWMICEIHES